MQTHAFSSRMPKQEPGPVPQQASMGGGGLDAGDSADIGESQRPLSAAIGEEAGHETVGSPFVRFFWFNCC